MTTERRRPKGEPGPHMPIMSGACGFDNGFDNGKTCGAPATMHLLAGDPATGPKDWTMLACGVHFDVAAQLAFDWHELAAVCEIPDAIWNSLGEQGLGYCEWVEGDAIQAELAEAETCQTVS